MAEAMSRVRADLSARPHARSVVVAHAFVAGAAPCDSERDISVGGLAVVPTSLFEGADYVALGHLHGSQVLGETVRYSGSPLPYSFSEADHVKGCWLVDLGPTGVTSTEFVPAPVPRPLARVSGALDDLLRGATYSSAEGCWVQATVTDARSPHAFERLQARFPGLLELRFAPVGDERATPLAVPAPHRAAHEIAADFVREMRGAPADQEELSLLVQACDACPEDPDADPVVVAGR
jgi:exonuclease SbcD